MYVGLAECRDLLTLLLLITYLGLPTYCLPTCILLAGSYRILTV